MQDNQMVARDPQQPTVIFPLVDLVAGYVEARDRIKQFDEEYDKNVVPLKEARDHFKGEIVKVFKERREFSTRVQGATVSPVTGSPSEAGCDGGSCWPGAVDV